MPNIQKLFPLLFQLWIIKNTWWYHVLLGIIPRKCFYDNNFRFYLAFENALCKDYVTEKIFNALRLNTIPVGISDPLFLAFSQHNNDVLLFFHVQPDKGGVWRRKLLSTASSQLFCRRKRICITKRLLTYKCICILCYAF